MAPMRQGVDTMERWGMFEVVFTETVAAENPYADVVLFADFFQGNFLTKDSDHVTVRGFYDGSNRYVVRFQPPAEGSWHYQTRVFKGGQTVPQLHGRTGSVTVTAPAPGQHGPVRANKRSFVHADGTEHFSVGTTAYAWVHQWESLRLKTISTLEDAPFNKVRFAIHPKFYVYNWGEPANDLYPYELMTETGEVASGAPTGRLLARNTTGLEPAEDWVPRPFESQFDFTRFDSRFWRRFDSAVEDLRRLGIQAEVILFHPYDRGHWGFDCPGGRDEATYDPSYDRLYIQYAVARLAAYSNVWWSLANEWGLNVCRQATTSRLDRPMCDGRAVAPLAA